MSTEIPRRPVLLVALGGNALIRKGQRGTIEEQFANLRIPIGQIAQLTREYRIIITHGNGPRWATSSCSRSAPGRFPGCPSRSSLPRPRGR